MLKTLSNYHIRVFLTPLLHSVFEEISKKKCRMCQCLFTNVLRMYLVFNEVTNKNFTFEIAYASCGFRNGLFDFSCSSGVCQECFSDLSWTHKIHKKMAFLQCELKHVH